VVRNGVGRLMIDCRLQVLMAQMCLNHHQSQLIKSQHDVWWMAAIFATDVFEGRPFIRLLNNHRPTITKGMRSNQIGKHQYRHSWSEIRLMGLINWFYRFTNSNLLDYDGYLPYTFCLGLQRSSSKKTEELHL